MKSNDDYWEKISEEYADEIVKIQPLFYENTAKLLDAALLGSKKVLDIGNGGVINYQFNEFESLDCADLALSKSAAEKYSSHENIHFIKADILDLQNIEDNSYDSVVVQAVLHHLAGETFQQTNDNIDKALRECLRVLVPSGKLLIVESTMSTWFEKIEKLFYPLMQFFFALVKFDRVYQYSSLSLIKKVRALGLCIVYTQEILMDKYIWIMRKKVPTRFTPCGAVWIEIEKGG